MKFNENIVNQIVNQNSLKLKIDNAEIDITNFKVTEQQKEEGLFFKVQIFVKTRIGTTSLNSPLLVIDTINIGLNFDTKNQLLIFESVFSDVQPEVFDFKSPLWHYIIFKISANVVNKYIVANFPNIKLKDQITLTPIVSQYGKDWCMGISFQNEEDKEKYSSLHNIISIFNGVLMQYEKEAYKNLEPYLQS